MIDKNELCQKVISLYPDIDKCGIDINVEFDEDQNTFEHMLYWYDWLNSFNWFGLR